LRNINDTRLANMGLQTLELFISS